MVDQPAARADVEPHIIALGRDPVDVARGDPHQARAVRRPEFLEERPTASALSAPPPRLRWRDVEPGAVERLGEPRRLDRLHQIIDRRDLERGDRELVEGGDEDHRRRGPAAGQRAGDVDPVEAGHGDVEQHDVGLQRFGQADRASPSLAVPTRSTPALRASSSCSRSAASGSSSAIRTLSGGSSIRSIQRQGQVDLIAALGERAKARSSPAPPKRASSRWQTLARPTPVPSIRSLSRRRGLAAGLAAVGDAIEHAAVAERFAPRSSGSTIVAGRRDAIFDRILDQRLEDQRRQPRRFRVRRARRSRPSAGSGSGPSRCRDRAAGGRSPRPG